MSFVDSGVSIARSRRIEGDIMLRQREQVLTSSLKPDAVVTLAFPLGNAAAHRFLPNLDDARTFGFELIRANHVLATFERQPV